MTTSTTDAEAIARIIEDEIDRAANHYFTGGFTERASQIKNVASDTATAILSYLASRREAQEPVAPFADKGYGSRLLREAVAYLNEYVFDFDSGADHEPTEFERFMMEDMLNGLFSHEPFFGIIRNLAAPPAPAGEVERLRSALEQFEGRIKKYIAQLKATGQADVAHLLRRDVDCLRAALNGGRADD